ncbi:MAG: hypothetical protein JJU20_15155 [Opitutales bacterium]|nr:hypothetical protein [Opitutales bacterium]
MVWASVRNNSVDPDLAVWSESIRMYFMLTQPQKHVLQLLAPGSFSRRIKVLLLDSFDIHRASGIYRDFRALLDPPIRLVTALWW